ncbi:MAG: hypothetical protein V4787_11775 [Pseudomonadota bacterium]
MAFKLGALPSQEISFEMKRNDLVEFDDGLFGIVNSVVVKNSPKVCLVIHTIKMNDGKWRAAVKVTPRH